MADEKDPRIGRTAPPVTMRVEFGKIREFANAIKDANPVYHDEAMANELAGGVLAPPTFSLTQAFWAGGSVLPGPKLDMDLRRLLHGSEEFEYLKPIHAGDVLTAEGRIADVFKKPGKRGGEMTFAIIETKFTNQKGELVLIERATIIETAKAVEN